MDILNSDGNIDPSKLSKIELVVGDIIVSSPSEITWVRDVITIKPSIEHLAAMKRQAYSQLVIYQGGNSNEISTGYTFVT